MQPDELNCRYGYSRQYFMGAMLCWLFEQIYSNDEWQEWVEGGKALSELLLEQAPFEHTDSMHTEIERREKQERRLAKQIEAETNSKIEELLDQETITIKLPKNVQTFRSFSPQSIISLGDGRLLHTEFVTIQLPIGQISIQGELALENFNDHTLTFLASPFEVANDQLNIHTKSIQVNLTRTRKLANGVIEVG